ncbi:MAG TPA: hypothetical protein VI612_01220 [Candidatus Nanoarchaeia archaeon]|nr:hypothetical protein [Candidatus Nanoarchaeia archaeon]
MGVVNVFYKDSMPPVVSRVIEHDGKFYEINFGTHYHPNHIAILEQIPPEKIDRTEPVHGRPSEIELVLMKELSERAGKIMVPMLVQVRDYQPRPNVS